MGSQQFKQDTELFHQFTCDYINTIRAISLYSTRARHIYDDALTVRVSDDLIQSAIGVQMLVENGVFNMAKREFRYLIETCVKYLVVDQELSGKGILEKTNYLSKQIPNASIDVVERAMTYFDQDIDVEFKNEIRNFFYQACAYVHPSQQQIEEQLTKYEKGRQIGFESPGDLTAFVKLAFRAYDMILVLIFTGFGKSMTKDIFECHINDIAKWKFHKGKYVSRFKSLL